MEDVLFIDNSIMLHEEVPLQALEEVGRIRPIRVRSVKGAEDYVEKAIKKSLHLERQGYKGSGQVKVEELLRNLYDIPFIKQTWHMGKVITIDQDLYATNSDGRDLNWCFGGFLGASESIGYVVVSTARLQDVVHARDLLRHEIGHMFGAPTRNRKDVEFTLGRHCSNDLCVMQQKVSIPDSLSYAHLRANKRAKTYCISCERDIRNYTFN